MLSRGTRNEEEKLRDEFYVVGVCNSELFRFVVSKQKQKKENLKKILILSSQFTADICLCYNTV